MLKAASLLTNVSLRHRMSSRVDLAKLSREELVSRATNQLSQEQLIDLVFTRSQAPALEATPDPPPAKRKQQKKRPFDMSRFAQRHIALRVAYIGNDYYGFAYQPDTPETVEGRLYEALQKTCLITDRKSCKPSRGGRTDKGVSALGQVIALHVRSNLTHGPGFLSAPSLGNESSEIGAGHNAGHDAGSTPKRNSGRDGQQGGEEIDYVRMLNRVLPPDIRVLGWRPVPLQFSARFSATHRTYK